MCIRDSLTPASRMSAPAVMRSAALENLLIVVSFCSVVGRLGFRLNGYYCKPGFMLCKVLLVKFLNFFENPKIGTGEGLLEEDGKSLCLSLIHIFHDSLVKTVTVRVV